MRPLIRSNPLRLAVLLWFAGWLVLVMPGHKRGAVALPGTDQGPTTGQAACCTPQPSCCGLDAEPCDAPEKPKDPARGCAICFLKAHLTDPPPVTLYTPFLGELDELAYQAESPIGDGIAVPKQLRGRAPPA